MDGVLDCEHVLAAFPGERLCKLLLRKLPLVKEIVECLKIMHEATLLGHQADLGLTEFYRCWVITKLKIQARVNQPCKTKLYAQLSKSIQK